MLGLSSRVARVLAKSLDLELIGKMSMSLAINSLRFALLPQLAVNIPSSPRASTKKKKRDQEKKKRGAVTMCAEIQGLFAREEFAPEFWQKKKMTSV